MLSGPTSTKFEVERSEREKEPAGKEVLGKTLGPATFFVGAWL